MTGSTSQPTCPYAAGELYIDAMGQGYYIQCNTFFTNDTIGEPRTATSIAACVSACDMYNVMSFQSGSQCLGVSWLSNQTTNNCLLKRSTHGVYVGGIDSAFLTTPYSPPQNGTSGGNGGGGGFGTTIIGTMTPAPIVTTYVSGGSTIVATVTAGSRSGGSGGSGGSGVNGEGGTSGGTGGSVGSGGSGGSGAFGGSAAAGGGGGGGGAGGGGIGGQFLVSTYVSNGVTIYSTYGVSTYVTNGITKVSTYGISTVASTQYLPTVSYVPSTVYGVSTAVSTYVSDGITTVSTYGVTTAISVVYITNTVTTTSVSLSVSTTLTVSVSVSVSASAMTVFHDVTVTEGGSQFATITAPPQTVISYVYPSSTSSSFTCQTYATNYLNGLHGKVKRDGQKKWSIFDNDGGMRDIKGLGLAKPQHGARPQLL